MLTDAQLHFFIANGYVALRPRLPDALHDSIYAQLAALFEGGQDPGNAVHPEAEGLQHVLSSPEVVGASPFGFGGISLRRLSLSLALCVLAASPLPSPQRGLCTCTHPPHAN